MRKISKSKVIAVALCIFIVTQMIEVVTLSVRTFARGGDGEIASDAGGSLEAEEAEGEITNRGGSAVDQALASALEIDMQGSSDGGDGAVGEDDGVSLIIESGEEEGWEANAEGDAAPTADVAPAADPAPAEAASAEASVGDTAGEAAQDAAASAGTGAGADSSSGAGEGAGVGSSASASGAGTGSLDPEEGSVAETGQTGAVEEAAAAGDAASAPSGASREAELLLSGDEVEAGFAGDGKLMGKVSAAAGSSTAAAAEGDGLVSLGADGSLPDRTVSRTVNGVTIEAGAVKKHASDADYLEWTAKISVESGSLGGASIVASAGEGQKMYGAYEDALETVSLTESADGRSWTFHVGETVTATSLTLGYMTKPDFSDAWEKAGLFASGLRVSLGDGGKTASWQNIPYINRTVPSITFLAVDAEDTPIKAAAGFRLTAAEGSLVTDAALSGSEVRFDVVESEGERRSVMEWTAAAGSMTFEDILVPGVTYRLEETAVPAGYLSQIPEKGLEFTVGADGTGTVADAVTAGEDVLVGQETMMSTPEVIRIAHTAVFSAGTVELGTVVARAGETVKDEVVSGVEYNLFEGSAAAGSAVAVLTSDADGKLTSNYAFGDGKTYCLSQTKAPSGYKVNSSLFVFRYAAASGGTGTITPTAPAGTTDWINSRKIPVDRILGTVSVLRQYDYPKLSGTTVTDSDPINLQNAAWAIYRLVDGKTEATAQLSDYIQLNSSSAPSMSPANGSNTTGGDGKLQFTGLDWGTYYLKETTTPAGYTVPDATVRVMKGNATAASDLAANNAGYFKIEIGTDSLKGTGEGQTNEASLTASGGLNHQFRLVDSKGQSIVGKEMTLEGKFADADSAFQISAAGTVATARFTTTAGVIDLPGLLIPGETYILKASGLPASASNTTDFGAGINLVLSATGTPPGAIAATVPSTHSSFVTATYTAPLLTVAYTSSVAQLHVQLAAKNYPDVTPQNAVYKLYQSPDPNTKPSSVNTTNYSSEVAFTYDNASGILTAGDLLKGYYFFTEVTAPTGFKPNETGNPAAKKTYAFSVDAGAVTPSTDGTGTWETQTGADAMAPYKITYEEYPASLTVSRSDTDSHGKAKYTLVKYSVSAAGAVTETTVAGSPFTIGATGSFTVPNLAWDELYGLRPVAETGATYEQDTTAERLLLFDPSLPVTPEGATFDAATMTMILPISLGSATSFLLQSAPMGAATAGATPTLPSASLAGSVFTVASEGSSETCTTGSDGKFSVRLERGRTYTVTQTTAPTGFVPLAAYRVVVSSTGACTVSSATGAAVSNVVYDAASNTIIMTQARTSLSIPVSVAYGEKVSPFSKERYYGLSGATFTMYCYSASAGSSGGWIVLNSAQYDGGVQGVVDASGKAVSVGQVTSSSSGTIDVYGLPYNTTSSNTDNDSYLLVPSGLSGLSDTANVVPESTNTQFKIKFRSTGVHITRSGSSSTGSWTVETDSTYDEQMIVAQVFHGSITFSTVRTSSKTTAVSGVTYKIYRLNNEEDARAEYMISGSSDDYNPADGDTSKRQISISQAIQRGLESFRTELLDGFALEAKAAVGDVYSASSRNDEMDWQEVASGTSDSSGKVTFSNLVAGQPYLIRMTSRSDSGTVDSNPVVVTTSRTSSAKLGTSNAMTVSKAYYMASSNNYVDSSSSQLRWAVAVNATTSSSSSSRASSARSGATLVTTGTGTQASGAAGAGAAGARGSATGDENRLWVHLIVMLIAFDALVADLIYMNRKKRRATQRRDE